MSRFKILRSSLPLPEALKVYYRFKINNRNNIHISKLRHPFSFRDNPYDYATFVEVILKEAYRLSIDFTPKTIIDGGGNIGLTAAYFATNYAAAKIVTLEPDKDNFELLLKNTALYKNISPLNAGIWNHSGYLLVKDTGIGNNGFMVEETNEQMPGSIAAFSITDVMHQMNWSSCDIVKLDVEGAEKEIFTDNYESWLPKTKVLIVELHDRMKKGCSKAVFSAISRYNFLMEVAGENLVFTNQDKQY